MSVYDSYTGKTQEGRRVLQLEIDDDKVERVGEYSPGVETSLIQHQR